MSSKDRLFFIIFRMMHAGIRCPEVVLLKKQVLVMSFIGSDKHPAPKLKDVVLTTPQATHAYEQCIKVCILKLCPCMS